MKYIIFTLIILFTSICYGQVPITKDRVLILVSQKAEGVLCRNAERHFTDPVVRKFMGDKGIQFILIYGDDTTPEWREQYKVTHYPAVVYLMKDNEGNFQLSKTVSGDPISIALGSQTQVHKLLGMRAKTYRQPPNIPSNHPLIPGSNSSPSVQYVAPPQQYTQPPQQFMNQWQSAPPST
jgi:hypothetical protein